VIFLLGTTLPVWIGVTIVFMGGCAVMMGRELAQAWRPARRAVPYALLLGFADRFLIYALFGGELFSPTGFVIDTYIILMAAMISYRLTLVAQMVRQYPWLYERFLVFGWRPKG
jgi:hypothetical protein